MTAAQIQAMVPGVLELFNRELLSDEFISEYAGRAPDWGPIGEVVYLRTYSRFLEAEGRREHWHETVRRVVEHSLSLEPAGLRSIEERRAEAEALFDTVWNLRAFPSGRGLWIGGTSHASRNPMSMYNCAYTNIHSVEDFHDMVILLMNGAGVGFGVREAEVQAFRRQGRFAATAAVEVMPYEYVGAPGTCDATLETPDNDTQVTFHVGDSREGWAEFVREFLWAYLFGHYDKIRIILDYVRPKGTPLKTFGGFASGPEPLAEFVQGVVKVFGNAREITSVMLLDTANLIGRMVVAGGTRRSAQIGLGSAYDKPYINAKTGDWWQDFGWRSQSNNSLVFDEKPSRDELLSIFEQIAEYGEPGFINGEAARKRRADWAGLNPCAEILLPDGGFCNLVTVNLGHYADQELSGHTLTQLRLDTRVVTRHNIRVTNVDMSGIQDKWDRNQKADRLLGVSFTGFGDFADAHGEANALAYLGQMRGVVNRQADQYAALMGIPRPLLATTVKPEGSISQLPGVSSGIHDAYAPYYLRRVRISDSDAVGQALDELGVPGEPDQFAPNTRVYTFPVKTHAQAASTEKSAVEQLGRYFAVMEAYVDHNASNTITFSRDEIPAIVDLLLERWDDYVAVSFLPKTPGTYPQMPYEAITEEAYAAFPKPDLSLLAYTVMQIESGRMTGGDDLEGCDTGACPIR